MSRTTLKQEKNQTQHVQAVADAVGDLIEAVASIKLAINHDTRDVPPTRSVNIVHCEGRVFRDLLVPHMVKLQAIFGIASTKEIWNQLKRIVHHHHNKTTTLDTRSRTRKI
ncbi:hypothetical protein GQ600_9587 [Phytophthora cactorum]|nr:hypothetical protein GQ600_9587 [Phytophthora cactorum]